MNDREHSSSDDRLIAGNLSRRRMLAGTASVVGAFALGAVTSNRGAGAATLQANPNGTEEWHGARSANGWPIIDTAPSHEIEGSDASVSLAGGDAATILLHVVRRLSYELDELEAGELTGHAVDRAVRADFESNYLSGSAICFHPTRYPLDATGGFFPHEVIVIRDILADCEGVVKWGGDLTRPKESHFQIDLSPNDPAVANIASKLRALDEHPSTGAGATDPLAPGRRDAAVVLERRQAA